MAVLETADATPSWHEFQPESGIQPHHIACIVLKHRSAVCLCMQLGHCPQEDYPEAIQDTLESWLTGETDSWEPGKVVASKMTKRGVVNV